MEASWNRLRFHIVLKVSECETGNAAEASRVAMVALMAAEPEQALPDPTWHL